MSKIKRCQNYADSLYKDDEAVNHYLSSINCSLCNEVNSINEKDEYEVFMDNCADTSLFNNSQMLENIKECDGKIRGIQANAPGIKINKQGTFLKDVVVKLSEESNKNILSQGQLMELPGWDVAVNNDTKDIYLTVPGYDEPFLFKKKGRLWSCSFRNMFEFKINSIETVKLNERSYDKKQILKAREALTYRRRLGYPGPAQFLKQVGSITDSPVSPHDAARGLNIYGRVMFYMKGKETWRPAYFPEPEEIPRVVEQVQKLHMDVVFLFGVAFLISVSFPMDLTVLTLLGKLGARSTASIRVAIPIRLLISKKHINWHSSTLQPLVRSVQLVQFIILRLIIDRRILKEALIDFVKTKIKVKVMETILKTLVRQILAMLKIKIKRKTISPTPGAGG